MANSYLNYLRPIIRLMPSVGQPKKHISLKRKIMWSAGILILYFSLSQVTMYGIGTGAQDYFESLRAVLAGRQGSLLTLGIGPIVTASIVLQLLQGSNMISLDMNNPADKSLFQGTQKLLGIFLSFFEGALYVIAGGLGTTTSPTHIVILVVQLGIGGTLLVYMDEVVSRWGVGSGISLFIAAGVSSTIMTRAFSPLRSETILTSGGERAITGAIPAFINSVLQGSPQFMRGQGLADMVQLAFTLIIFAGVIYIQGMKVEIPLSYGRMRTRGRYPLKFIYTSVLPVILASALFMDIQLIARVLYNNFGISILGVVQDGNIVSGFASYFNPPRGLVSVMQEPFRAVIYAVMLIIAAVVFGKLWVELTGLDSRSVAQKLKNSGMKIPGFRGDVRILEKVLDRYIPYITIMGSATIGLLAALAQFTGALGSGTGILLTAGILYKLYEEISKEKAAEMFPGMRSFLGK